MRTIRFTFTSHMDRDNAIEVSTEVIVNDDEDIEAEGIKVGEVVGNFLSGVSEGMQQG